MVLSTESVEPEGVSQHGNPTPVMSRPTNTPLRNDGINRYWMMRGETYRLHHDGIGWQVSNDLFRHTYRLVDAQDAQFVSVLPLDGGELALDSGVTYEIREQEPMGSWGVYTL